MKERGNNIVFFFFRRVLVRKVKVEILPGTKTPAALTDVKYMEGPWICYIQY